MKKILAIASLVLISLLLLPLSAFAEDVGLFDEFGNEIPVISPTVLTVNGETIEPDKDTNSSNYTINSDQECVIEIVGNDTLKGSLTLEGTGIFWINSAFKVEGQITLLGGEFYTGNNVINAGSFYVGYYQDDTPIFVSLGDSEINVFAWAIRGDGVKVDAGNSTINTTLLFDNSAKDGRVYNNVNIKEDYSTPLNPIYGFVEGNSSFNNLKVEDAGKVYVVSQAIEAVSMQVTKGTLSRAITDKVSTISKGALDLAKADGLKDVAPVGKGISTIGKEGVK